MSGSTVTDEDIAGVLGVLSLNYDRPLGDEATVAGLMALWRAAIGGCAVEDVVAGLDIITRDESVRRFPTVAQFRAAVIAANRRRRHDAMASPAGTVACLTCLDSGWVDLGADEDGSWWVRKCPNDCKPPLAHHRQRPRTFRSGRSGPTAGKPQQLALSRATLEDAIASQHRTTGDRDGPGF